MSTQQNVLLHGAQGKVFPPSLVGISTEKAGLVLGFKESIVSEPLAISPADISVGILEASQFEAVQVLRQEINLDLHYRLDPDFFSREKKEMS
jgi:hypothetical protein